jgi:hypothetical protein
LFGAMASVSFVFAVVMAMVVAHGVGQNHRL